MFEVWGGGRVRTLLYLLERGRVGSFGLPEVEVEVEVTVKAKVKVK